MLIKLQFQTLAYMQKIISLLTLFLFSLIIGRAQVINGTYFALKFNQLMIDTSGEVQFFMSESFAKEKWFHQVEVTIKGNSITIDKYPVHFDSAGIKWYSVSDGGFLTYKGQLIKHGDMYIAKTVLTDCDYIGFSIFAPPTIISDTDIESNLLKSSPVLERNLSQYETYKTKRGFKIYLPKGTVRQDLIIRQNEKGIWINNKYFYKRK